MEDGKANRLAGEASFVGDTNHQLIKIAAVEHANEGLWRLFETVDNVFAELDLASPYPLAMTALRRYAAKSGDRTP
jgi:hypothetical protein